MLTQGRIRVAALWLVDVFCVAVIWAAVVGAYYLAGNWMRANGYPGCSWGRYELSYYLGFWPVPLAFTALNASLGLYHGYWLYPSAPLPHIEEFRRIVCSALMLHTGTVAFFAFAYGTTDGFSRFVALTSGLLVGAFAQSFRNWMRRLLFRLRIGQIPVVLAGAGHSAAAVAEVLRDDAYSALRIVGYFDGTGRHGDDLRRGQGEEPSFRKLGIPYLGTLAEIVPKSRELGVKMLLACQDERCFRAQLDEFSSWFVFIDYLPAGRSFPVFGARSVCFDGLGGFELVNQGRMRIKRFQKRLLDTLLAIAAFVCLSPLFVVIPLLIKLTSKGPVFYRHCRLGRNGKPIRVWKFRSMFVDADERLRKLLSQDERAAAEWRENRKLRDDPRVTMLGKFLRKTSLDELPQFFNVISGEMALIGPRPITKDEVERYGSQYAVFSSVRPGVTGLWQVSGRSDADYGRRVALDIYYVFNWSPWMDIWILLRTVGVVLLMRGAR